jgi:hypothetical protein
MFNSSKNQIPQLNFRIRSLLKEGIDDSETEAQYRDFVRESYRIKNRNLWAFFGGKFFDGGQIRTFQVNSANQSVTMQLGCPNILHYSRKNHDYEYVHVWLDCVFMDVVFFLLDNQNAILSDTHEEDNTEAAADQLKFDFETIENGGHNLVYARSEVDTLTKELYSLHNHFDQEFHSLLIQTQPDDRMVGIVFRDIRIEGQDADAFEFMCENSWYHVPLYKNEF